MNDERRVRVNLKRQITSTITRFELAPVEGTEVLPEVLPGAHVTVTTPAGQVRSYSITDYTPDGYYGLSILREANGRGGSRSMHDDVNSGDVLTMSGPRNAFPLEPAEEYLLIAGGIGITAIRFMYHSLRARGANVTLLYLARRPDDTAYLEEFSSHHSTVRIHHSAVHGRVDLWPFLAAPHDGRHVYCCASTRLMDEVRALTMHWRPSRVHFEDFAGVSGTAMDLPFNVVWSPTGTAVEVTSATTLLDTLNAAGAGIANSCRSGTCGTCVLQLEAGEVEHRDLVLTDEQRTNRVMACVSRAAGALITVGPVPEGEIKSA